MTIGFGDFVPGQQTTDPNSDIKLVAIAIYSLFGIALIGMCASLMQGAARRTFRRLSYKVKKVLIHSHRSDQEDAYLTESDREREKQEILSRIKLLQNYEGVVRKRNI